MGMGERKMKRYSIGLITGILLTASALPLIAQEDASGLTLEKNGKQVLVPLGERVMVSRDVSNLPRSNLLAIDEGWAYDPTNTVSGLYVGMTADALRIQQKGQSLEGEIPINEIGSIFTGKVKSTSEYVLDGAKLGGLVASGVGVGIIIIFLFDSGFDLYAASSMLAFGGLWTVISGIFTVPAGALLGFIEAKAAEGQVVEYVIGDGEWVIVK